MQRVASRKNTWTAAGKNPKDHADKIRELQEALSTHGRRDSDVSVHSKALSRGNSPRALGSGRQRASLGLHSAINGGYQPISTNDEEDTDGVPQQNETRAPERDEEIAELDMNATIDSVVRELRISLPKALEFRNNDVRVPSDVIWGPREKPEKSESKEGFCSVFLIRFGTYTERIMTRLLQILALVDLIYVPFILSFSHVYPVHHWQEVWMTDLTLSVIYFTLAVPIRLRTTMVDTRTRDEITDPVVLRRRLLGYGSLWTDVLAILIAPMLYADLIVLLRYWRHLLKLELPSALSLALELRWLGIIRILKVWRLKPDGSRTMLLGTAHITEDIFEVVFCIFLVAHLFGCVWFWAKTQSPEGFGREWTAFNGWAVNAMNVSLVDYAGLSVPIHADDLEQLPMDYVRSFKDGIYMLAGWGGPDSTSHVELSVAVILGPLSSIISGLILARLMQINEQRSCLENQYANKMATIHAACDGMELPQDLRGRINRYHSYMSFHQMDQSSQDMLFSGLSVNLLAEVKLHCMRDVIAGTSFFEGLPPRLISFLVVSFEETTFSPGDVIVRKNEIGDMMYIIMRGRVGIFIEENQETPVAYKYPGNYFGEISLVFPMPRTAWIRAVHYVVLMQLNKEKFDYILEECPHEKNTLLSRIVQDFRHLVPDLDKLTGDEGMNLIQQELTKAEENVDQGSSVKRRRESVNRLSSGLPGTRSSLTFGSRDGSRQSSARGLSETKTAESPSAARVGFAEEGNESVLLSMALSENFGDQSQNLGEHDEDDEEDEDDKKVIQVMQKLAQRSKRQSVVSLAHVNRKGGSVPRGAGVKSMYAATNFSMTDSLLNLDDDDQTNSRSFGSSLGQGVKMNRASTEQRGSIHMQGSNNKQLDELADRVKRMEGMLAQVVDKVNNL